MSLQANMLHSAIYVGRIDAVLPDTTEMSQR